MIKMHFRRQYLSLCILYEFCVQIISYSLNPIKKTKVSHSSSTFSIQHIVKVFSLQIIRICIHYVIKIQTFRNSLYFLSLSLDPAQVVCVLKCFGKQAFLEINLNWQLTDSNLSISYDVLCYNKCIRFDRKQNRKQQQQQNFFFISIKIDPCIY